MPWMVALQIGMQVASNVGAVVAASKQQKQANQQARVAETNALLNQAQARQRTMAMVGRAQTILARSGVSVDEGSPQDVIQQTIEEGEFAALQERYAGQIQAWRLRSAGQAAKSQAIMNLITGGSTAAGTLANSDLMRSSQQPASTTGLVSGGDAGAGGYGFTAPAGSMSYGGPR